MCVGCARGEVGEGVPGAGSDTIGDLVGQFRSVYRRSQLHSGIGQSSHDTRLSHEAKAVGSSMVTNRALLRASQVFD